MPRPAPPEHSNPSWVGLRTALERTPAVSHVDISGIERAADADILIAAGVTAADIVALRLRSASWLLVVVAGPATAGERIELLELGADLVLHGAVPDDEIVAQVGAIARRAAAPVHQGVRSCPKAKILLDTDGRHAVVLGRRVILTPLEGNLLAVFIARPEEVLDSRALMTGLWGSPYGARSTVSASVRRLRVRSSPIPPTPSSSRRCGPTDTCSDPMASVNRVDVRGTGIFWIAVALQHLAAATLLGGSISVFGALSPMSFSRCLFIQSSSCSEAQRSGSSDPLGSCGPPGSPPTGPRASNRSVM